MASDRELSAAARFGWAAAFAVALFLAFPRPVAGSVVDLGWIFAWVAPALLLASLRGLAPARGARNAFLAGWLANAAILNWIYVVTVHYGHAPPIVGIVAPIGLALYAGLFTLAFGYGWRWLDARGFGSPFAAALLWTVLDHGRSFFLTGFPWATLGYAQHENGGLLWLAPFTGVYGLSFASVLGGAALWDLASRRHLSRSAAAALATVAALLLWGLVRTPQPEPEESETVRIAAVQGNIEQGVKWSEAHRARTLSIYTEQSRRAVSEGAQLVVWPETAVPGALEADSDLRVAVEDLARETGATFVVGGVGLSYDTELGERRFYDSAFLLGGDGSLLDRYDKSHLVPFGEYVPFRALLGSVLGAVARGIASLDVSPGDGPRPFSLAPLVAGTRPVSGGEALLAGVPICYELLFPHLVREFVDGGAGVLLAITNDAWYGRTGAPYQFLAMTAMRSAENGVWTVRAANTGVSAVIDGEGRVRKSTRIFEQGILVADVPVAVFGSRPPASFYARHGDVFAVSCWVALFAVVGVARFGGRKGAEGAGDEGS